MPGSDRLLTSEIMKNERESVLDNSIGTGIQRGNIQGTVVETLSPHWWKVKWDNGTYEYIQSLSIGRLQRYFNIFVKLLVIIAIGWMIALVLRWGAYFVIINLLDKDLSYVM